MESIAPQKLNIRVRDRKRKLSICLDNNKDALLCNWANRNGITNHYGLPNRSAAIEKLIELFANEPEDNAQNKGLRGQ